MSQNTLTLGHSPDPDDAFMFYALAKELIPTHGFHFQHILQDIQTLNDRAMKGELEITAISIHAYPYVADKYALTSCGSSMGDKYGPMVVTREPMTLAEIRKVFHGPLMGNCGYTEETAEKAIAEGHADLISFGTFEQACWMRGFSDLAVGFYVDPKLTTAIFEKTTETALSLFETVER